MPKRSLRDHIKLRLRELGVGAVEAASAVGLEKNFIKDLVDGRKESFSQRFVPQVAEALQWTEAQLQQIAPTVVLDESRSSSEQSVSVPEMEVRGAGGYGGGFSQEEQVIDESGNSISRDAIRFRWGFPLPFLRDELRLQPGRVHILAVRGDSMADALYDGDRAIIDLDDTDVSQGGIFALLDDIGAVIIKQVELVRGESAETRRILCKSRNPNYAPFHLPLADPVKIIGRVACKITRL